MEKYDPFKRELFFHQELVPKIEGLLLSVDDNTKLTEKCVKDIPSSDKNISIFSEFYG